MNKKNVINKEQLKKAQNLLKAHITHKVCPDCGDIIKYNKRTKEYYCKFCNKIL